MTNTTDMKEFRLIFKLLMRNLYARRVDKKGKRMLSPNVVTLLVMIPLVFLFSIYVVQLALQMSTRQEFSNLITSIVSFVQVMVLIITIHTMLSVLYGSEDAAFFNSLPLKQTSVFFAKFAVVYVTTLQYVALLVIPFALSGGITFAIAHTAQMFWGYFAIIILFVPLFPLLPLAVLTLLSMPIEYVNSFFKGRAALKSALTILSYIVLMTAYIAIVFLMGNMNSSAPSGEEPAISATLIKTFATVSKAFYPNKAMVDLSNGIDVGQNIGISLACIVGLPAVMFVASMLFYKRISRRGLESHSEKHRKDRTYKPLRVIPALMKKDILTVVRNPRMALSSFAPVFFTPIVIVIMYFAMIKDADPESASLYDMLRTTMPQMMITILCSSANALASMAYSREGKSYHLTHTLPISARQSITAKLALSLCVTGGCATVCVILTAALYRLSILSGALMLLGVLMCVVGSASLLIFCDIKTGNVNWSSYDELRNAPGNGGWVTVLAMLVTSFVAVVPMFFAIVFAILVDKGVFTPTVYWIVYWVASLALDAALAATGLGLLFTAGEKLYDKIGSREFIAKDRNKSKFIPHVPLR